MPLAFLVVCVHADFTKKFSYAGKQVNCAYDIGYHIVNFISHTLEEFYKLKYCSTVVYMVPRA